MSIRTRLAAFLFRAITGEELASVTVRVDDSPGWTNVRPYSRHDYTASEMQQLYTDALTAWRKNPLAWNIVRLTSNYIIGTKITISSPNKDLQRFIESFWHHPENSMLNRLEGMADELTRSGDLFPLLFLNKEDGMSYLRFLTKDEIQTIETAVNDREKELIYVQATGDLANPTKNWYSPANKRSRTANAIGLHYSVNKPIGALFGESDLVSILPWLLRYSRMLDDRVRLHWSIRAFLWFVKVPSNKVSDKQIQYQEPPEPGSVIVHDDGEEWEMKSPNLRGSDAAHDLKAIRGMVDAGSGFPPHWRGEGEDVNVATADAMQEPTERHLARRQRYFVWLLCDILYQAYQRATQAQPELWPPIRQHNYEKLFTIATPDISRTDNERLSKAAHELSQALERISAQYDGSPSLKKLMLQLILKFAGEPQDQQFIDRVMQEAGEGTAVPTAPTLHKQNGKVEGKEALHVI